MTDTCAFCDEVIEDDSGMAAVYRGEERFPLHQPATATGETCYMRFAHDAKGWMPSLVRVKGR